MSPPRKVALVTGAGSGIGRAVSIALSAAGYAVVCSGRRLEPLEEVAGESHAEAVTADVTDPESVAALFARIESRHGRLDLLVNNAGASAPAVALEDVDLAQWRRVLDTNVTGTFLCTQAAFRLMKAQRPQGGRIINNGSISASVPRPRSAPYTASKHAVTGLTKATSLDGRTFGIACGQIDIGNAATPMASPIADGVLQADLSVRPEPLFDVRHVADAVVFMASLPLDANVQFLTVMATTMPFIGRG